jgi:protease-4
MFFVMVMTGIMAGSLIILSLIVSSRLGRPAMPGGDQVGVIEIAGVIADARAFCDDLKAFREDETIKAIVVRIDSPGGGVGPSQEIYRAIGKAREKKHVIASMGALAASGGYYAAAATEGIMASPGTITGSIGVIMGYTNFKDIFDKVGLVPVVIKSGDFKDTGSPVRDMREDEKIFLQKFVDTIHDQFVQDVSTGRNMPYDTVQALADGRIYAGSEAKDLGLVDRLGNLEDAVEWAGELAGITGEITVVYPPEPKRSLLEYLTDSTIDGIAEFVSQSHLSGGYLYRPGL